jgi:hypothetical protein
MLWKLLSFEFEQVQIDGDHLQVLCYNNYLNQIQIAKPAGENVLVACEGDVSADESDVRKVGPVQKLTHVLPQLGALLNITRFNELNQNCAKFLND